MHTQGNRHTNLALYSGLALTLVLGSACSEDDPGASNGTTGVVPTTTGFASTGTGSATTATGTSTTGTSTGTATGGTSATGSGVTTGTGNNGVSSTTGTGGSTTGTGSTTSGTTGTNGTTTGAPMGDGGMAPADGGTPTDSGSGSSEGTLPHVETTDGPGPFGSVVKVKDTPPGGWLIYPEEIGKDGIKHPLFMFGPGGGTTPQDYEDMGMHWDRYGSYGFVIYVPPRSSFGGAAAFEEGLTWLIAQNDESSSPLYQHLDTSNIAVGGHSLGSEMTFNFMPDERVTTTIHISGGSLGGSGVMNLSKPTMFMCGPSSDVAHAQCENDFELTEVPTFYTNLNDSSHTTTARDGWAATIAWMLWHLAGHEEWRKEFLEPDGQFQTGIYSSQTKNW